MKSMPPYMGLVPNYRMIHESMKRTRYYFTLRTTHPTLNGTTVSRVAENEASARKSILKVAREAAPDATLTPHRRCMEDKSGLSDR